MRQPCVTDHYFFRAQHFVIEIQHRECAAGRYSRDVFLLRGNQPGRFFVSSWLISRFSKSLPFPGVPRRSSPLNREVYQRNAVRRRQSVRQGRAGNVPIRVLENGDAAFRKAEFHEEVDFYR